MLRIDLASRVPVYEQIADGLRAELVSRKFSPGEKLPPVRTLAVNLGVHPCTYAHPNPHRRHNGRHCDSDGRDSLAYAAPDATGSLLCGHGARGFQDIPEAKSILRRY